MTDLFSQPPLPFTGDQLKEIGMGMAEDNANRTNGGWSDMAYEFMVRFIKARPGEFMGEDVRNASIGHVPEPPSNRAWGSIMLRAARAGLIERVGFRSVANPKAHSAPCGVWRKKNEML